MNPDRKTAIIVGVLFVLATAFSLISTSLTGPVVAASDYLASAAADGNQVVAGALFLMAAAVSVFLIPAMIFPVLRRHDEGVALGYLGFRTIEAVTLVADAVVLLLIVSAGQQYVKASSSVAPYLQASGSLLLAAHNWLFPLNPVVFGSGALMFYALLYRSRLVPTWLSAWGLIGAAMVLAFGLLDMFGEPLVYLAVPIGVQEMALAAWLVVKGFNQSSVTSQPAQVRPTSKPAAVPGH